MAITTLEDIEEGQEEILDLLQKIYDFLMEEREEIARQLEFRKTNEGIYDDMHRTQDSI